MFGTELDTAYFNTTTTHQTLDNMHNTLDNMHNTSDNTSDSMPHIIKKYSTDSPHHQERVIQQPPPPTYDSQMPIVPVFQQNDNIIKELQHELEKQRSMNKRDSEPLYERFISKKKDVMKLLNIALTVLLAISLHYVLGDLLKSYLQNNDFSTNKETMIKLLYPASVLLVLWSFKVFNK